MMDPVVAPDGNTFERSAIQVLLSSSGLLSPPLTREISVLMLG
jgi:hypothetical protein